MKKRKLFDELMEGVEALKLERLGGLILKRVKLHRSKITASTRVFTNKK